MNWITSKKHSYQQIDEVGNIFQKRGGVQSKACQVCKAVFKATTKKVPIKQFRDSYKCKDCEFKSTNKETVLDHLLTTTHKFDRSREEHIVGYNTTLEGILSKITLIKTKDVVTDVEILCEKCYDIQKS